MHKKSATRIKPQYAAEWDKKNPRLKWAGLTNDERVAIRLAWQNKQQPAADVQQEKGQKDNE